MTGTARGELGHRRGTTPSVLSHAVVAGIGAVVLAGVDWPLAYDGLLNTDYFAVTFLVISGSLLAVVGGVMEGLLERSGWRVAGGIALAAFAVVAIYPPLLMSARWFDVQQNEPQPSSAFGLALVAWLVTVAGEYAVARTMRVGSALGCRSSRTRRPTLTP